MPNHTSPQRTASTPCPAPGAGVHSWILATANRFRVAGLPEAEAERQIAAGITRPPSPANEIRTAIAKAYASNWRPCAIQRPQSNRPVFRAPVPITEIAFDPAKLKAVAERITRPVNWRLWLWERSPKRPETQNAFSFLAHLYRAGEIVLAFNRMDAK